MAGYPRASRHVLEALTRSGVTARVVESAAEIPAALAAGMGDEVLIATVGSRLPAAELVDRVSGAGGACRLFAFPEELSGADLAALRQHEELECVARPASLESLERLLLQARAQALRGALSAGDSPSPPLHGIVGQSRAMQHIFALIVKVAATDANVLICGESGTGKELIARAIHYISARRDGPLVTLDCAAVPENLVESQLFGHVKGAFTGAVESREGVFSLAHSGTLFLDELCELALPLQAKLLRVVQNREFFKVGGAKPLQTDVRLIAATNKDARQCVVAGTFREDLYYRLAVVMMRVPPLRERKEDIPLLVEHYLKKFATAYQRKVSGVSPAAMKRIVGLPWPGNVRQLANFVEQAVTLADGEVLTERDLPEADQPSGAKATNNLLRIEVGLRLREVEQRYILRTLQKVQGNRTQAARLLGISVRGLQYKLNAYQRDAGRGSAAPAEDRRGRPGQRRLDPGGGRAKASGDA